ncbi:ABC transporter substrate-binding protein [Amnibacterium flavum]|nr:ABC transporter substrate-binding protein [Amnibacterium flavum]
MNDRIRRFALAALAVTSATALLAGCAGGDASGSEAQDRSLRIVLATEPVSLDPCDTQDAANAQILRANVLESLTRIDAQTGEVVPLLAEEWEASDDNKTWTFTLKEGVTFHDGAVFDAEAAATAVNRVLNTDIGCGNGTTDQFPYPVTTTVIDENTLQLTSEQPDGIFPLRMTYIDLASPNTPTDAKTDDPIGTGPFELGEVVSGESITLTPFADYWGEAPEATEVTYLYRTEPTVRASMITTGEADLAVPISAADATDDGLTKEYSDNRVFFLRTQTNKPPFNDPRVREAVHYAIDRETIVGALMERSGLPYDQLVAPTVNAYLEGYEGPGFDPDKATELLDEAAADGVAVDTTIELVTRPDLFPGSDEVMQSIAQNLTDVGFSVQLRSLDTDAWLQLLRKPFPPEQVPNIIAISHDNISGDASFTFPKYVASTGTNSTLENSEIDALIAEAETKSGDERAELYQEASKLLYDEEFTLVPIALQTKLLRLAPGIDYEPNGLTGVELRISDITFTG